MTFAEVLAALDAARSRGVRLGLDPLRAALAGIGAPERRLGAVVHVGGTNGKGSTAAFLDAALRAAGLRVGVYTSPHLARLGERVRVNGEDTPRQVFAEHYGALAEAIEGLTFFEQVTATAFAIFAEAELDACVLEVGLGGRYDATNVVDADVAVVTGVALDHTDVLGATVEAIAREKAGIFKPGRAAVVGAGGVPAGREVLIAEAKTHGAELRLAESCDWELGLVGAHQRFNAACALAALDALAERTRVRVPEEARRQGLREARWPGRLEHVRGVLFDCAHNPDAAAALAVALAGERPPRTLVVGVSVDKDARAILSPLVALGDLVIATRAASPRALAAAEVAALAAALPGPPGRRVTAIDDPTAALATARAAAGSVCVCGSIFLVGPLRAALLGEEVDPFDAQDPPATRP